MCTPLRVGMVFGLDPLSGFNKKDDKGRLVGYDVDVARKIGEYLGRDIEFVNAKAFSNLELMLLPPYNSIDIIIGQMDRTNERNLKFNQLPYTRNFPDGILGIFIKVGAYTGPDYLNNILADPNQIKKIGVIGGSVHDYYLTNQVRKYYSNFTIERFNDYQSMIDAVKSDIIDELIGYPTIDAALIQYTTVSDTADYKAVKSISENHALDFLVGPVSIGIRKSDCKFNTDVSGAINRLINNGKLEKYEAKWNIAGDRTEPFRKAVPDLSECYITEDPCCR